MLHAPLRPRVRPSSHARLFRLLGVRLAPRFVVTDSRARDWASASFSGERHHFVCTADDGDALALIAPLRSLLVEAEWRLPGHIVADVTVEPDDSDGHGRTLVIEILTVAD